MSRGGLFGISDLHVEHPRNRQEVERLTAEHPSDWLLIAGDVANTLEGVEWTLETLRDRFEALIWVPGNHELHCYSNEVSELRGHRRYLKLVELCRSLGVITPEDPYPVWDGSSGPTQIVPLFLLYDYSFGRKDGVSQQETLARAYRAGVVCDDEFLLHPDPYPSREAWCRARVEETLARLDALEPELPTVLVNHFPLREEATHDLMRPQFAQWCGTRRTLDWHIRFNAVAVVHGHLHIPRTRWHDGVPFEEVSFGNPREWRNYASGIRLRRILPRQVDA